MAVWNLLVLLFVSVSCNFSFSPSVLERPPITLSRALNLEELGFEATSTSINALTVDDKNNIYVLGTFDGKLNGIQSNGIDSFLLKLSPSGIPIWKKHFRAGEDGIVDTSGVDNAVSLIWDDEDRSIYFLGQTNGPFIESNDDVKADLFIGKISEHGKVSWLRHYGKETGEQLGADFSQSDSAGAILMSPKYELIATFQTGGSVFQVNPNPGVADLAILKVDPKNGDIIAGQQIAAPGVEGVNQGTFAFDGNRIVVPFRTQSELADVLGKAGVSDAAYVVLEEDLSVSKIVQLGQNSYAEWANANNFSGSIVADDQFRSVVVNGPGDYLFFGKTNSSAADTVTTTDFLFARYVNHKLVRLVQYGANTFPEATKGEEPRYMIRAENGRIYCVGHTRSALFETLQGSLDPVVFRVDADGNFISGVQLGSSTAQRLGATNNYYTIIQQGNFIVRDGKIVLGAVNSSTNNGPNEDSMIWQVNAF